MFFSSSFFFLHHPEAFVFMCVGRGEPRCIAQFCNLFQHGSTRPKGFLWRRPRLIHHSANKVSHSRKSLGKTVSHQQCCPSGAFQRRALSFATSTFRRRLTCTTQVVRSNTEPAQATTVFSTFLDTRLFCSTRGKYKTKTLGLKHLRYFAMVC